MKALHYLFTLLMATLVLVACNQNTEHSDDHEGADSLANEEPAEAIFSDGIFEEGGLKIYPLEGSPAYADAGLSMTDAKIKDGKGIMSFEVSNYELGQQTEAAEPNGLANSGKGQHIHLIVNNGPYSAHYEPKAEAELKEGNNIVLAFLSRSYHESVKNASSYVVKQVANGEVAPEDQADLSSAHMFYSRPKGTYTGNDAQKVLLDFFLLNSDLSEAGYKVRATFNGGTSILLGKWQPYVVEGLPMGENTVKLAFLDAEGNLVNSPFAEVERTFTLAEEAAE